MSKKGINSILYAPEKYVFSPTYSFLRRKMKLDMYSSIMGTYALSGVLHGAMVAPINVPTGIAFGSVFLGFGALKARDKFLETKKRNSLEGVVSKQVA